jgi:tetratricopeptide (TPR) repeat protein
MNLLQRLKIWRELKRLELRVREEPSPTTFVDLGQVYINLAMIDEAVRVAEEGLTLFPNSEELRKLRRFAKQSQLKGRIKDLNARLARSPHPKLYRELASVYLELGDTTAVSGTCEECIRRFPEDDGAYLVLGKAHLTSFYRDLAAREGLESVRCLQKVIALDPGNVKAHRMLAELLYRIGAVGPAVHHLEILRELAPQDDSVRQLLAEASRCSVVDEELAVLFHNVESTASLVNAPVAQEHSDRPAAGGAGITSIRDALAQIAEIAGVRKAAYINGSKAFVKGEIRDGKDGFLRVVRVVAKCAQRTSRRMELGNFNKGVVEGDFGHICICSYGEVTAAVLCDPGTLVERVLASLQELVAGSLYLNEAVKA